MCIQCRQMHRKQDLFRIVKQDDVMVLDKTGKLNGRGAYLCKNVDCIKEALQSNKLKHHLKVDVPQDLAEVLDEELKQEERMNRKPKTFRLTKDGTVSKLSEDM